KLIECGFLTLLKNLAFCFSKFRKKPVFLMRGCLAPPKLREGEPASFPQTIPHSKTSLGLFLNNAG
ncbi:MAG: hypothetical protein V5A51_04660, partial [Bacteroidales bacterium]